MNSKVSNILAVYALASDYEISEGLSWYSNDAYAFCETVALELLNANPYNKLEVIYWTKFVAAAVAVLSPQKEWRVNKALVYSAIRQVINNQTVTGHYPAQCAKVVKLYNYFTENASKDNICDEAVLNIISKPDAKKTRNFYLNIIGIYDTVTVDGHAASICENGVVRVSIWSTKQPSGKVYNEYAAAYIEAAELLNIPPAWLQAITWVTYRRLGIMEDDK